MDPPEPPDPLADVRDRRSLVQRELLTQATLLFATKGYAGTSLTDIADALGLTRGAVYHYFKNKDALLEAIIEAASIAPARLMEEWLAEAHGSQSDRLRGFVHMRVMEVLQKQTTVRMIEVIEAALPPDLLERHKAAKRRILGEYRSIIRDGIAAGEFRPVDDRVAALGIIGMVNWSTAWFVPNRGAGGETVAAQLADMAVRSLLSEPSLQGARDPAGAIDVLRRNLDQLAWLVTQADKQA